MILVRALERGLSLRDFEYLEIGMIVDYISEYNELSSENSDGNRDKVRMAEQADFNSF